METLHRNVRFVWVLQAVLTATVVGGVLFAADYYLLAVGWWPVAVGAALAVLGAGHALWR
jgi:hypothetical protein